MCLIYTPVCWCGIDCTLLIYIHTHTHARTHTHTHTHTHTSLLMRYRLYNKMALLLAECAKDVEQETDPFYQVCILHVCVCVCVCVCVVFISYTHYRVYIVFISYTHYRVYLICISPTHYVCISPTHYRAYIAFTPHTHSSDGTEKPAQHISARALRSM